MCLGLDLWGKPTCLGQNFVTDMYNKTGFNLIIMRKRMHLINKKKK